MPQFLHLYKGFCKNNVFGEVIEEVDIYIQVQSIVSQLLSTG